MGLRTARLIDVIPRLPSYDDHAIVYAKEPWTAESDAVVARDRAEGDAAFQQGFIQFMAVWMAREFLEGWFENVQERPSLEQQCERLIHYSIFDA